MVFGKLMYNTFKLLCSGSMFKPLPPKKSYKFKSEEHSNFLLTSPKIELDYFFPVLQNLFKFACKSIHNVTFLC